MVYQIVYSSVLNADVDIQQVIQIAREAQDMNTHIGVTGVMAHHKGSILQVLEGDRIVVETLYFDICSDPRHSQIVQILGQETKSREFPDWSMGFQDLPDEICDPNILPLSAKTYKELLPDTASDIITSISQSFALANNITV